MNIYTYYEKLDNNLEPLVDVWRDSWEKQGFNPIVLTREDSEKSFLFKDYYNFIQRVHVSVSGDTLNDPWCLAAQLEIVAFTTICDEASYVSDYDVINKNFTSKTTETKLHWRDSCCSCFASGNKESWIEYVNFLLEQEQTIINWCLQEKTKTKRKHYHDQDFLIAIEKIGLEKNVYEMSRSPNLCKMYFPTTKEQDIKLYHLSHNNIGQVIECYKKYNKIFNVEDSHIDYCNPEEIRVSLAKQILNE